MPSKKILYIGNKLNRHGFTPTTVETLPPLLRNESQFVTISDKRFQLIRLLHIWFTLLRTAKKYHLVLIDTYSTRNFHFAWTSGWICQRKKIRYIPIIHGGLFAIRMKKSPKLVDRYLKEAHQILAPSKYIQRILMKEGYKVEHIPNTINYERYPYRHRHKPGATLLWVRSLSAVYNPLMALEVLKQLVPQVSGVFLHLVGPPKDISLHTLENYIKKNHLQSHVKLWGYMEKAQWIALAQKCDIFLNTSQFDNMPVTLIEAMALGLPLVTTDAGGIPDMLTHAQNALLVPVKDNSGMVSQILKLLKNDELRLNLSQNAHAYAETYAWKNVKKQWIDALELAV